MFRKISIAFVLLLLLSAVSYIKMNRENSKVDTAVKDKTGAITSQLVTTEQQRDSLTNQIQSNDLAYSDSLLERDKEKTKLVDSLSYLIDTKDSTIESLDQKLKDVKNRLASSQKKTGTKQLSQHEKIYRYYKQKYASLPKDLSAYEHKIALNEIREETAKKFSITMTELNKVRNEYKLDY